MDSLPKRMERCESSLAMGISGSCTFKKVSGNCFIVFTVVSISDGSIREKKSIGTRLYVVTRKCSNYGRIHNGEPLVVNLLLLCHYILF